jgi:proteic killer suppression protein
MDILFSSRKEQEIANSDAKLKKVFRGNPRRVRLIRARLDELADVDTLAVMRSLPQSYCHELTADRKGQLAVKLDKGYRMVFEVANDPIPLKTDGGLDWNRVTAVRVLKLAEDYHD